MLGVFKKLGSLVASPITFPVKLVNGGITQYAEKVLEGQVRHLIGMGGAWLVSQGLLAGSDTEAFVGAAVAIAAMLMSAAEKKLVKQ